MFLDTLPGFGKSRRRPRSKPARHRFHRACQLERLEDRCLLDSCFNHLLTTQHVDLTFNYAGGAWDLGLDNKNVVPIAHTSADSTLLFGGPAAQTTQPADPQFAFLGAGAGNPVWILPQLQNPSLLYLGTNAEHTPPGTLASYFESDPRVGATFPWEKISLRAVRGPGQFSMFQTNFDGSVTVWMASADGIGPTDAAFIPEQSHVHFNWGFTQRGFYEVDLQASAFLNDGRMTPITSPVTTFYFAVDPVLQVTSLTPTPTGFEARFNRPIDPSVLNLYDDATAGLGPADATLIDASGQGVAGSLIPEGINCVRFVKTGGVIDPGIYTVTLRSAANGFKTTALGTPGTLDGNGDGTPGDDYTTTFTVSASPAVGVGVPDFMRGPGQAVNVPATALGLPLQLSDGAGVTAVDLTLRYDPALLTLRAAAPGDGLPAGATVALDTAAPGAAVLSFRSPTALGAGARTLALLSADVPDGATYAAKQVLDLTDLRVNGGAIPALDDDGVQVVGYFGDTTGNGSYSALDATRALRGAVGLDTGFGAYQLADPVLIADVTGNGILSAADATSILRFSIGQPVPQIPPLPPNPPVVPPGGPDPRLSFPTRFTARPGQFVEVPLNLDISDGLQSAELAISYDVSRLDLLSSANVLPGSLTEDFDLFAVNVGRSAGTVRVALARTAGPIADRGPGSVLRLRFRVRDDALPGAAVINLRRSLAPTFTGLNEGGLVLDPAPDDAAGDALDGLIAVDAAANAKLIDNYFRRAAEGGADDLAALTALLSRRKSAESAAS